METELRGTVHHDDLKFCYSFNDSLIQALSNYWKSLAQMEAIILAKATQDFGE